MSKYTPDAWAVLEITTPNNTLIQKVLAGWSGGYLDGDSWRLSSNVVDTKETDTEWIFTNESGSIYHCNKNAREFNTVSLSTYNRYKELADRTHNMSIQLKDFTRNT